MLDYISNLLENPAFWTFLGIFVSSYFGYKAIVKKIPSPKQKIKNASSFEELRSVVEILQNELEKKDKRHRKELENYDLKLEHIRDEMNEIILERNQMIVVMRENGLSWPPDQLQEHGKI